jgi:hypothetical protein
VCSMNPNFLLKDELQYELCIHGISSDADIQTLRKLFRSVVSEGLPINLRNLCNLSAYKLYGRVASKIVELQYLVTQQKSTLSLLTSRFITRISHLRARLTHLKTLELVSSNITTSQNQELHDQLNHIERNIIGVYMADRQDQKEEQEEE